MSCLVETTCFLMRRLVGEKTVWKAERALRGAKRRSNLSNRERRAKSGIEPLLTDLWPSLRTQISEGSKGVCSLGRRAGYSIPPEKGRQGVSMKLSSRRKGESGAVPPPRYRRGKSCVFLNPLAEAFLILFSLDFFLARKYIFKKH